MKKDKSAIVIGSGFGGLASAIRLAVKGYRVKVFEASTGPGGKAKEIRANGYRFDAGPSLFTEPDLVDELFQLAKRNPRDYYSFIKLDAVCRYQFPSGEKFVASGDQEEFAETASKVLSGDKKRIEALLNKSAFIYKHTAHLFLERSLHKLSTYLRFQTLVSVITLPFIGVFSSMHKANNNRLRNSKLSQLFNRYATYNGSSPYKAPAVLNIIPHLEFGRGAFYPKNGIFSLTKALYQLALDLGVEFEFNQKVGRIIVKDRQAVGVKVLDKSISSDVVICNMDVVPAYKYLLKDQKQPTKILNQERSSSALIFYWGIKQTFKELDLHNIFFAEDYKKEFEHLFEHKTLSDDLTVYVNITSKFDEEDAPENGENWFVMVNAPHNEGQDWESMIAKARYQIIKKLSSDLNKDISDLIEFEEILDPRSIESKTSSFKGSLYGTASNDRMAAFFRHPNFSRKIERLYFVGGSVHPGGGIPLALSSAKIVDDLID